MANNNLKNQEFKLIAKTDNETDELGYMIEGTPFIQYPMVANEGLLVAHDLLEHVNGVESIGSIDDELEALAGVWFVRGQYGQLRRDNLGSMYSPEENIASDILNMAQIYNYGVEFKTDIPETTESDIDEIIIFMIEHAKERINGEIEEDKINQERLSIYFNACLHYMRQGWEKINERFNGESWNANQLFWTIAEACDEYGLTPEYDGQELKLTFDIEELEAECKSNIEYKYTNISIETPDHGCFDIQVLCDDDYDINDSDEIETFLEDNNIGDDIYNDYNGDCILQSIVDAVSNEKNYIVLPADDHRDYTINFTYTIESE